MFPIVNDGQDHLRGRRGHKWENAELKRCSKTSDPARKGLINFL